MGPTITFGIAAGVSTAVLFGAIATGFPIAMLLYLLTPFPAFAASLRLGPTAAAVAGGTAAILLALAAGPAIALAYAGVFGVPVWVIAVTALRGPPDGGARLGRVVGFAVILAGIFGAANVLLLGPDEATYRATIKTVFEFYQGQIGGLTGEPLPAGQAALVLDFLMRALPAMSAVSWLAILLANLWLALRLAASGPAGAPLRPELSTLELPPWMPVTFLASLGLSYGGAGVPALVASAFAGAHGCGYTLQGLALIHRLTLGRPARNVLLIATYAALLVAGYYVAFALITFALAAPVLGLGRRPPSISPNSPT